MINTSTSIAQLDEVQATVQRFINLAARGLVPMFDQQRQLFCYRLRKIEDGNVVQEGISRRYTMMTLMGLHRLKETGAVSPIETGPILRGLVSSLDWIDNIGDLGLLLWVSALTSPDTLAELESRLELDDALARYRGARQGITMELAWFLTGLSYCALTGGKIISGIKDLASRTYTMLKRNQGEGVFFGHLSKDSSVAGMIRGRVGSFADQVYPIYAFAQFSKAFHNDEAASRAMDCAAALCEAQGPLGQWWWHYDSKGGRVIEGYPVFSVHQHAMGPMTLFALGETVQHDFNRWIFKGLRWISSQNELRFDMEDASSSLIWRCISRSQISFKKYLKTGFGRESRFAPNENSVDLKVLFECRPYELGWLLYAFASRYGNRSPGSSNDSRG